MSDEQPITNDLDIAPPGLPPEVQDLLLKSQPPGTKPTKDQVRERTEFAIAIIGKGVSHRRATVNRLFRERYGEGMVVSTINSYLARARNIIARLIDNNPDAVTRQRVASYLQYLDIVADTKAPHSARVAARRAADELLGLQMPRKLAVTTAAGKDIPRQVVALLTDEQLAVLTDVAEQIKAEQVKQLEGPK